MKQYCLYMNRQEIAPTAHERLLSLGEKTRPKRRPHRWKDLAALAACCALVLGFGVMWGGREGPEPPSAGAPLVLDGSAVSPERFEVTGPDGEKRMFPMIPYINYQPVDRVMEPAASIALMEGSFRVELTREDIQTLFWGPEGKPEAGHPKTEQGSLPWTLFWEGYELGGWVIYDGGGDLFWLMLSGSHPEGHTFELELSIGRLPPTCLAEPGLETTEVLGTEVTGWSRAYDRDGDDVTDYICGSEFMAGDVGVRFENVGSPFQGEYGGGPDLLMGGAAQFNALFVRQALTEDGGLYLDRLRHTEDVPEWREAEFDTLAEARQEEAFAPYLPLENVPGYGEFRGRLTYQEGHEDILWVRWSRGYDDVEVCVYGPEGDYGHSGPVDVSVPASYDTRLYTIPWYDSVPEEYQGDFYMPNFRAEDMSLAVVEARGTQKDTGGTAYRFGVLHPDGTLVQYSCSGLTAVQVWAMVRPTLENS